MESVADITSRTVAVTKETALLAAEKSVDAVAMSTDAASSSVEYLVTSLVRKLCINKERCKALLLDTTYETRRGVLLSFKDLIKTSLTEDPYMCKFVKISVERVIDRVWNEVEDELERDLEAAVLQQLLNEDVKGPASTRFTKWYWRSRAFLLNHYFPNNKSIFGKIQDPVYVFILCLSLSPIAGIRFVIFSIFLFMLWTPGPPDEYMLLNFIMLFKGFQFLSTGILKSAWATVVYFACYSSNDGQDVKICAHRHGPASASVLCITADYMGNVMLTWIAWCSLRHSAKYAQNRFMVDGGRLDPSQPQAPPAIDGSLWTPSVSRSAARGTRAGGLFHVLMYYDLCCFTVSLLGLVTLTLNTCRHITSVADLAADHQFQANLFWANVLFSVTTLPFLPLNVPWLFSVCTRSSPTGFNENGACVAFRISLIDPKKRKIARKGTWRTLMDIKDLGRLRRRETSGIAPDNDGPAGITDHAYDFSYGLWRAVLYSEMDSKDAAEIPDDMVVRPDQLMMVWDRF
mmetsp:Transcript_16753/g.52524  ORF Transcript_16753/g.52524 Transcript_16753/m.52524 type:complete len:517 (-) Transcript_16753:46-1596(-)